MPLAKAANCTPRGLPQQKQSWQITGSDSSLLLALVGPHLKNSAQSGVCLCHTEVNIWSEVQHKATKMNGDWRTGYVQRKAEIIVPVQPEEGKLQLLLPGCKL